MSPTLKQIAIIHEVMTAYAKTTARSENQMTIESFVTDYGIGGVESFVITGVSPEQAGHATFKYEFLRIGGRDSKTWGYRLASYGENFEGSIDGIFNL